MRKRLFRQKVKTPAEAADYPTLDEFDGNRRSFLARLGGLLGATALAGVGVAACGDDRTVNTGDGGPGTGPDYGQGPAGVAPMPDAGLDTGLTVDQGIAPMPDARVDPEPDAEVSMGIAPEPDARIDTKPDFGGPAGVPVQPDAGIDEPDFGPLAGAAPMPDAAIDGGECPNP